MKIIFKDFCTFTVVYVAIYMGPCCKSYILLVRKFQNSEMLDKWSPTSKLSDVKLKCLKFQTVDIYFFHLYENPPARHTY